MELIGLSDTDLSENEPGIIDMLNILLDSTLDSDTKIAQLAERYDISPTVEMRGEIEEMCNYSQGILQDGIDIGISRGIAQGISQGIKQGNYEMLCKWVRSLLANNMPPQDIAFVTQTDIDTILEIIGDIERGMDG